MKMFLSFYCAFSFAFLFFFPLYLLFFVDFVSLFLGLVWAQSVSLLVKRVLSRTLLHYQVNFLLFFWSLFTQPILEFFNSLKNVGSCFFISFFSPFILPSELSNILLNGPNMFKDSIQRSFQRYQLLSNLWKVLFIWFQQFLQSLNIILYFLKFCFFFLQRFFQDF